MNSKTRLYPRVAIVLVFLSFAACIHQNGSLIPTSPLQKVAMWNDLVANGNHQLGATARQLNASGLLNDARTAKVVNATGRISADGKKVTAILDKASSLDTQTIASLSDAFNQIRSDVQDLIKDGDLWVENPQSKLELSQALEALANTVQLIVQSIQAGGSLS